MSERGRVARDSGQMREDLVIQVKEFELYPKGKGEPVKGFKGKSDPVCLKFGKIPLVAACKFGRRKEQREGWNETQVREEEA